MPRRVMLAAALAAVVLGVSAPSLAQSVQAPAPIPSREVDLDVMLVSGVLTYAWQYADGRQVGVLAGAGWDELGRTLTPDPDREAYHDFEQLLFVGGMHRWRQNRLDIDMGARLGLGGVRAGGDLPDAFGGLYVSTMYGGRRFRFGPRAHLAYTRGTQSRDVVVHVEPIVGRVIFGW